MSIILWTVISMKGELVGEPTQINISDKLKEFEDYQPPTGYTKAIISQADYEILQSSFNAKRKIYEHGVDPIESKAVELLEERKAINEAKAKPRWMRTYPDGRTEIKDENGKVVPYVLPPEL